MFIVQVTFIGGAAFLPSKGSVFPTSEIYEMLSSLSKSLKIQQLKLLHKHIIDVADELYRFSDKLDMSDKEEMSCQISIMEALKELNHVTEYLTKHTLSGE